MKLAEYMILRGYDDVEFAKKLEVDRTTVYRLRIGKTVPTWKIAAKIAEVSGGAVTPNDFLPAAAASEDASGAAA